MKVTLRVRPEVYEAAKEAAADERRSLNRQLEVFIEEGLARRRRERGGLRAVADEHPPDDGGR